MALELPLFRGKPKAGKASPLFRFSLPSELSAGATWSVDLEEQAGDWQRFLPFENADLINDSDQNVEISINDSPDRITVIRRSLYPLSGLAVKKFSVRNLGSGAVSPGQVIINLWNEEG